MKSTVHAFSGVLLTVFFFIATATAHAQQAPNPVEIIACNFVNGSDGSDLEGPMSDLNEWMDERNLNSFNVSTLTPIYTSEAFTYDVLFLNRWTSGAAMGRDLAAFFGPDGGDAVAGFNRVVDCSSDTAFAGILLQAPGASRDGGPTQFLNCTLKENRNLADAIGSINRWAEMTRESDADFGTGHAVLLPIAGENPAATYTFKWLVLFESFESYGQSLDALFGPGGPSLGQIINPVMDCDSARLYNQVVNRQAQGG